VQFDRAAEVDFVAQVTFKQRTKRKRSARLRVLFALLMTQMQARGKRLLAERRALEAKEREVRVSLGFLLAVAPGTSEWGPELMFRAMFAMASPNNMQEIVALA
jgi:hypothetical protein